MFVAEVMVTIRSMMQRQNVHIPTVLWVAWGILLWAGYPAMGESASMSRDPVFTAMALGVWIVAAVLLLNPGLCNRLTVPRRVFGGAATFVAGCSYTLVQVYAGFLMGQLPYVLDERLICLIASAIAAACWSWEGIFLAKGCGGRDDAGPSGVSRVFDARRMRMVPALFFCIGCLRPLAMMWCFPHFACGALWGTQVVGNPMASLGLVASVIGVGMWVVRIARPGVGSPTGVSRRYACALLGSYASGEVASYAASCAIPLRGPFGELASYGLCMVLVVAVIACVFVVWRHTGQEAVEGGADESSLDLDEGDERRHERLAETYHLTERETVCLLLALDGMTSAAIAERLGIKAPTVRAYQQRAYRKMEVASLTEARELVARQAVVEPLSSPDTPTPNERESFKRRGSGRLRGVQRASRAFCSATVGFAIASVALPTALDQSWGAGDVVLRAGIVMACTAAAWAFSHTGTDGGVTASLRSAHKLSSSRGGRLVGDEAFEPFGPQARAATWGVLCEIVFASAIPGFLSCAAIVAIVLCAISSSISWMCHHDAGGAAISFVPVVPTSPGVTLDVLHVVYLALLSLMIGIAWEEVWRSASPLSFAPLMMPLFGCIIVMCVGGLRSQGVGATRQLLSGTLVVVSAAESGQASVALFGTSVLVIYLLALSLRNTVRMSARGLPLCALFGVAGILGGGKVTNVYADLSYAQFRDVVFGGYASMGDVVPASGMGDVRTAMLVAIVTCLTLLMLLTVWAGVRLLTDVRNERYAAALLASHNADRSRLESYLAGRGLNSVQVEVALRIVAGESGPQIARAMCYSIGTVNSARDAAYRLLRVHRRAQLVALLRRDAGL